MSIEENVQVVKDFFAAIGSGDKQRLLALLPKILSGSFPARTGRWPARTAGTRDWRTYFRRLTKRWKLPTRAPRVHSARRPGSGRRRRYGENQSHE